MLDGVVASWRQLRERVAPKWKAFTLQLDKHAATRWFRFGVGAFFVAFHLWMFVRAGDSRLHMAFNTSPDEAPYFDDIHAAATRGKVRQPRHWSRLLVSRWDAQHYEGTALRGLQACPTTPPPADAAGFAYLDCGLGWMPAWGWVGHLVLSMTGVGADYALVIATILAALALSMMWTSKVVVDRIGRLEAYMTLIAFNLYPSGFYTVTPYSETFTLALAIGAFVALSKERWFLSAALVGAVTGIRMQSAAHAAAIGCALLVAAYQRRQAGTKQWWKPIAAAPLCGWGLAATWLVLKVELGDGMAFFEARDAFGRASGVGGNIQHWDRLTDLKNYLIGITSQHLDMAVWLASAAIIALTAPIVLRKFSKVEATFLLVASVLTMVFAVIAPLRWWGITRYSLLCPLTFLGVGWLSRRHKGLVVLWLVLSLLFYWHLELCGYISQGDPKVCPCMGRMEFSLPISS